MTLRVALHHTTRYDYDRTVTFSPQVVRLRPAPHCRTPIVAYSLKVSPEPHFLNWQQDPFGNYEARIVFLEPAQSLSVEVDLVAEMTVINPFDFFLEEYAEKWPFAYAPALRRDLAPYLERSARGARFDEFVEVAKAREARPGRRMVDVLVALNQRVQSSLKYDIRMEPGVFAPEETLERGHGSCRDFAWLLVQMLRGLGLAARFVSGYSIQLRADQRPVSGPAGVEHDATDLHAWVEVFLPGAGWVGLDATSGLLAGEGHIPLACTPDFETAAPITGSFAWNKQNEGDRIDEKLAFSMSVQRIEETPRVTLPYSEDAWRRIDELGHAVDHALETGDVRLTMGGEPTFVSDSDPDGAEWNTDALGPTKRGYATRLARRILDRFVPGALLHEGQGKSYPGEPLPRWAISCYFRKDREPIWEDPSLFAPDGPGSEKANDAAVFAAALARALGVETAFAIPAYEDVWYYLWRERRLPANVDPLDSRLEDEMERARLSRIYEQGLKSIVGYALPLQRVTTERGLAWQSGPWFFRTEHMYLLPGDSPMGFRLPLDSLPWVALEERPSFDERDPFAPRDALPARRELGLTQAVQPPADRQAVLRHPTPSADRPRDPRGAGSGSGQGQGASDWGVPFERPRFGESAWGVVRTAVCVEPRQGVLHVFLPPVAFLEDYLDLVAVVEKTARALAKRVRIEGYHPPGDPRIGRWQVTPDPGVIEVNVDPSRTWEEVRDRTLTLYEEARQLGLRAEKFMMDGRHSGTGGGNHVTLGGPTAADSPILRRPDVLASFLTLFQNHPSLSYLFSGLFVGPTSQSPRVDEARHDSLYELDVAYAHLRARALGGEAFPWLVDRMFRNLLVDITGNTHRTEFCIDKLYSPDTASGRLGIVELRAFEMPPHARMSAVQQLLVRALVAAVWKAPYHQKRARWATDLHDRFALGHFVWQDFEDVLDFLRESGFAFDPAWFRPHFEFRFPKVGHIEGSGGVLLEFRQAIEPWHVLGEEPGLAGTVRYVDTSLERIEVKVRGMIDDRHVIACNGRRVPLHPTGTRGESVGGVRYRAWCPPSSLHPTIGVHVPLVFDVIDTWNERSIAGCRYHVAHPGGRSHDLLPRNSFEAEGRRVARFAAFGHTPGKVKTPPPEPNPDFPFTLDLRYTPG